MLEINMTIKCGNCITHDNYDFNRDALDDILQFTDTINTQGYGHFSAKQSSPDVTTITCNECGHHEDVSI